MKIIYWYTPTKNNLKEKTKGVTYELMSWETTQIAKIEILKAIKIILTCLLDEFYNFKIEKKKLINS